MLESAVGLITPYPVRGKVLTAVAEKIGDEKAYQIFAALVTKASNAVCSLSSDNHLRVAFIGQGGLIENFSSRFPGFDEYLRQDGEDIGEKMLTALSTLIEQEGAMRALLVGADTPDLTSEIVSNASKMLDNHDLVLGPSADGSYYLIGMRRVVPDLFFNIDWETKEVLNTTMQIAEKKKLTVALLPELRRLDTADDLDHFWHLFKSILQR
jgi:rSAM/selenodomain-associated transferase 1